MLERHFVGSDYTKATGDNLALRQSHLRSCLLMGSILHEQAHEGLVIRKTRTDIYGIVKGRKIDCQAIRIVIHAFNTIIFSRPSSLLAGMDEARFV